MFHSFLPLLLLAILMLALRFSPVDMEVARSVYDPSLPQPWRWAWQAPWRYLYEYGVWPAWIMAAVGAVGIAVAAGRKQRLRLRRAGLFLVLVTSLGPGLLVNLMLKPWCGRPRPRDLTEFGGQYEFVPVLAVRPVENGTSFPSGHAAMAFSLFAPAFLLTRRSGAAMLIMAAGGAAFGVAVGTARILQGAHFVSDIVGSAAVVYITALVLWRVLRLDEDPASAAAHSGTLLDAPLQDAVPSGVRCQ